MEILIASDANLAKYHGTWLNSSIGKKLLPHLQKAM